jgi:hypothetical protein
MLSQYSVGTVTVKKFKLVPRGLSLGPEAGKRRPRYRITTSDSLLFGKSTRMTAVNKTHGPRPDLY